HPRRRRVAVRRPAPGQTPPGGNARQAQECLQPSEDGAHVRAHRDRRPLPGRLYAEVHDDETAVTATDVLRRAVTWFAARGIITQRVLSDNGSPYRSHLWRETCAELEQDRTLPPHPRRR